MAKTNLVLHGAAGRMGVEIARIALADDDVHIVQAIENAGHPALGRDIGLLCGRESRGVAVADELDVDALKGQVVVDFTFPGSTLALLEKARAGGASVVIGTTGFSDDEREMVVQAARHIPILMSPNMSLGVNLLFSLTELVAGKLGDTHDIEITEAHHRHKKDAPSGTAVRLAELAAKALGSSYDTAVQHGRKGMVGERPRGQIGMHAVRGGDIVGDHTVLFAGDGDRIELRHVAHNRSILAQGAVAAAKWLNGCTPGLYDMRDMLGF